MAEVARIHPQDAQSSAPVTEEFLGRMEKELNEIRDRLSRLEQVGTGTAHAHKDLLTRAVADIRERKAVLEAKIQEAKSTTKGVTADIRSGLELAWEDLKTSMESATSRFFH